MYYSYGWWFFWGFLLIFLIWGAFAWWPQRDSWRSRAYRPYGPGANPSFPYRPYTYSPTGLHRGRGPRGYRRSDERIVEDVNDQLTFHDYLDATDILVQSKEGVVTLSGSVSTRAEKRLAEFIADSVPGVLDVKNELAILKPEERPRSKAA